MQYRPSPDIYIDIEKSRTILSRAWLTERNMTNVNGNKQDNNTTDRFRHTARRHRGSGRRKQIPGDHWQAGRRTCVSHILCRLPRVRWICRLPVSAVFLNGRPPAKKRYRALAKCSARQGRYAVMGRQVTDNHAHQRNTIPAHHEQALNRRTAPASTQTARILFPLQTRRCSRV